MAGGAAAVAAGATGALAPLLSSFRERKSTFELREALCSW